MRKLARTPISRNQQNRIADLLLQNLPRLRMNLFVVNLARVPSAAKGLHQKDRTDHLLAEQLCCQALVIQQAGLGGNYVEISGDAANVSVIGDGQGAARILDRGGLGCESLRKSAQVADTVFDLLEGSEHRLAIVGNGLVVRGAGRSQVGAVPPTLKNRLQGIRTKRPDQARCVEE